MRLLKAFPLETKFHDGTKSMVVGLVFAQDGDRVVQRAKISGCAVAIRNELRREAAYLIRKLAKEAAREIHFGKHGYDGIKDVDSVVYFDEVFDSAITLISKQALETK